ncbi:MAG TPA: ATP synthase F0 subunit B [Verrucomicrobiae bacterium]|nr:ATP synthase F0 subunit B [Verrucomicrobiae bacterium]
MEALKSLGIDPWSIVLYLVNFGLLLAILTRFLYKPVLKFLDQRREQVRQNLEEAETLKRQLADERQRSEAESRLMAAEASREVAAAKASADEKSRAMMAEAEAKREKMMAEAESQIATAKSKMMGEVEQELMRRIEKVAMNVLSEKVPAKVVSESVTDAWKELNV